MTLEPLSRCYLLMLPFNKLQLTLAVLEVITKFPFNKLGHVLAKLINALATYCTCCVYLYNVGTRGVRRIR